MDRFILRQYNAAGQCIDHSSWTGPHNGLHVVMFDVRLIGCVRFEVVTL